jgi:hypothetical protein
MKNVLILLLLCSCSYFQPRPNISETPPEVPKWVYSPYDTCNEEIELCATGEAKSFAEADAQARNNLASIFEVKIKSDLMVQSSSSENSPWHNGLRQEVQHSLDQSIDQILEVVQIKLRFKQDGLSYALATLDRVKASELLGKRIEKLDQEIKVLWKRKSRTSLRTTFRLYLEREKLNERYSIVSGSPRPEIVSYEELMKWRDSRPVGEPVALRIGQAPEWMTQKLKEILSEAGFKVVRGDSKKAISLNIESIKEFLNVEGFEKYTFTMHLASFENGERKKLLSASETVTGRTQGDALLKVRSFFNDYIEKHLSDLHLD